MKTTLCALLAAAALASTAAAADTFFVYKATASLPVVTVQLVGGENKFVTRTLAPKDIINIALGRPLTSAVDAKREILAVAGMEDSATTPTSSHSKLIIYDGDLDGVVATIGTLDSVNYRYASKGKAAQGFGIFKMSFVEIGNPLVARFFATSNVSGPGWAKGPGTSPFKFEPAASGSTQVAGRVKVTLTDKDGTVTLDGLVVKGKIGCSGKPLGTFTE